MADSSEVQPLLPLQYKTWVLKVSIHCEGCKKMVKKILTSMEDVYKVEVDALQNKVTVTGNVDAEVIIKRLLKSGKHAQLSQPEKKDPKKDNINKLEQQPKTNKPPAKKAADAKPKLDGESIVESTQKDKAVGKSVPAKNGAGTKSDPDAGCDNTNPDSTTRVAPAGESDGKDAGDGDSGVEGGESGKKKKKKKKNGQKGQSSEPGEASEGGKVGGEGGGCYYPGHPPTAHQLPTYSVSYHAAHPTWSYAVNYVPPEPPHFYAYAAPPPVSPSGWDTHRMSSDENPNSCFLM